VRNAITLWRRETRGWFLQPVNYVMAALFLVAAGLVFWNAAASSTGKGMTSSDVMFGSLFFWLLLVGFASAATSRVFAAERESGVLELLLTAPVRDQDVVLAKYGGVLVWLGVMLAAPAAYIPVVRIFDSGAAHMDTGTTLAAYLLVLLVASLLAAAGTLASLLFRRQAVAAAVTFAFGCVLLFAGQFEDSLKNPDSANMIGTLAAMHHIREFTSGMVDSRTLIYYLSVTAWLLFVAVRVLEWQRWRRAATGWNACVAVALAALLTGMVNHLSVRHYVRMDLTTGSRHTLAERTLQILTHLPVPVQATLVGAASQPVCGDLLRVLQRYADVSPRVTVRHVDPDRDLMRTKELAQKYGLREGDVLILEAQDRYRIMPLKSIAVSRGGAAPPGITADSEQIVSSAIHWITQPSFPVVYFAAGHGERDIKDFDRHAGYSEIARRIAQDGATVKLVTLGEGVAISNECAALIVAGPARRYASGEVAVIRDYLGRGGRALFLLDAGVTTGLEDLLGEWGVRLAMDRVLDQSVQGKRGAGPRSAGEVYVSQYGTHPITRKLNGMITTFCLPRSVEPSEPAQTLVNVTDRADKPRVTVLASSSAHGWADSDPDQTPPQFDEGYDRPGPVPIAVAVEKGVPAGINVEIRPSRIVVVGDSQFVSNGNLTGGNSDFFMNAVNWLMDQETLITAAGRPHNVFDLRLDRKQKALAFMLIVMGIPALAGCLAGVVGIWRRDRRAARRV
jgi:ABC-type transport system involved in multi-copper enzyme maturation permease subunit